MSDKEVKEKKGPHRFKPGESGNPAGRPKGVTSIKMKVQQSFLDIMEAPAKGTKTGQTNMSKFLDTFMTNALNDPKSVAHKMVAERLFEENILESIDAALNKEKTRDIDFLQFRVLKKAFDEQQARIRSKKKTKLNPAGRRSGKTETNVLETAFIVQEPDKKVLIVGLTMESVIKMYWDKFTKLFTELGIELTSASKTDHMFKLSNGSEITFKGNSNVEEREKMRGFFYDAIIVDEAQSQRSLKSLVEDILEPMLLDRQGTLIITGSGPRTKGTYWEYLWNNSNQTDTFKLQWNLTNNPFIPNRENVFKEILEKKGLTENSPLFKREYLGEMDAYDDDALVLRLSDSNYYTKEDLESWIARQPLVDLRLTAGLDYGWTDPTAFVVILYSESSPELWVLNEWMESNASIDVIVANVQKGLQETATVKHPIYQNPVPVKFRYIWADHNEQRMTQLLGDTYRLPMMNAMKTEKKMAMEVLRDEVRMGNLKVPKGGLVDYECQHTIYQRDEQDNLTKEIDDGAFHPNILDAVLYSLREYWNYKQPKLTNGVDTSGYTTFLNGSETLIIK